MTNLKYNNNSLYIENVSLSTLAQEFGTPLYVYSQNSLTEAFNSYAQAFGDNTMICYAVKANGNLSILRHFANLGAGFDIVSGGELARVIQAGGNANRVIFSGVGKSVAEIEYALKMGIRCFNVESLPELHRINEVSGRLQLKAPISLRINPDVDAKTHPYISTGLKNNKFGIAYKDAMDAYKLAQSLPNLDVIGIDCHIGSQLTDISPLIEACQRLIVLIDKLKDAGINLKHVDLGGGVGIRYLDESLPELSFYANQVKNLIANRNLSLILEPGRSLVGNAGVLLTRIEHIKHGEEKNFIITNAAMNDLMRPTLYQAYHHIVPVVERDIEPIVADIVGPICESGDFLAKERSLKVVENDLLAICSAGAYAMSMASNYNARCRGAEVMVNNDSYTLIRRRETMQDLWQCELLD
ncbi:MAG: diaminopimelate decarboxylase [Neisseriaceae bacterium]|nr:diaminopimelate decarboxylase [Neisseriaceae bacterium]